MNVDEPKTVTLTAEPSKPVVLLIALVIEMAFWAIVATAGFVAVGVWGIACAYAIRYVINLLGVVI